MNKYKSLITILVVFGSIQLIVSNGITPLFTNMLVEQGVGGVISTENITYLLSVFQYSVVLIWFPVSVWIYNDSKKSMFTPWLWAILILTARYQGLIIYLLIQLIMDKEKNETVSSHNELGSVSASDATP